jgi:hypothetical protein
VVVRGEVLRRDQVAAVELAAGQDVVERVVLAARLDARAAVRGALADHPRHVALAAVRDAQRAVHERLEADVGHRLANRAHVVERVLAGEHHALDPDLAHHARAARVVHRHLRRPVDLELGVDALDEPHDAEVLHDRRRRRRGLRTRRGT